ncbi:hypothetical protein GNY06_09275 [Elizabethkingia argentiflava]|uniref:MoaF-like domain-containing protein n=1 Tax=Elizabethkingia argenteiflava TaxID=2681556 RepID=A0A845PTK1_9FLAO|nr:MoaF N-terminal domain-containing protein [Elizabethkingia argenteiflava]NAW51562.1 hypothetical protein [Elizabethkingia argenteiflava]
MITKIVAFSFLSLVCLTACNSSNKAEAQNVEQNTKTENYVLLGKKAKLTYPEFEAEVHYISDRKLHWKTLTNQGKVAEGDEEVSYKQLSSTQFLINWIESSGMSVSQVVDMEKGRVTAFITYGDENSSRGKRSSNLIEGKWMIIN